MGLTNYNKLKKKYSLPEAKKLMERLEIEIEDDKNSAILLQSIRNTITERLYDLMKALESMLFTNEGSEPNALYQEQMLASVANKGFGLYKLFNELHYHGLKLRFSHDRKKDADFINRIYNMWPELEKDLSVFFGKLELGWKKIDMGKETRPEAYHG